MKITLSQLKSIIKEEVTDVKQAGSVLPKGRVRSNIPKMSAEDAAEQRAIEAHCVGAVSSAVVAFEEDFYAQMTADLANRGVDISAIIEEHEGAYPVSYMAYSNLKNIINNSTELLSIMNSKDDLPQWADEALTIAKINVTKTNDLMAGKTAGCY